MTETFSHFSGSGLLVVLFLASVVFLMFKLNKGPKKTVLVWFSVIALFVFFCPLWLIFKSLRTDGEILYRILWLIPMGAVVAYALVELIALFPKKWTPVAMCGAVLLLMVCGKYVYGNVQFHKAENEYHIPQSVVDICDEIKIEGREIRACFPLEMVQYVRQYTSLICQPYGRDNILWGSAYDEYSTIAYLLDVDVYDTAAIAEELRRSDTAYFIVSPDKKFAENITDYGFSLVKNIDGYDVYLDDNAYLGLNFDNK